MLEKLLEALMINQPSQYEEFYEDVSWKTFRVDESIWNSSFFERPGIAYYRQLQYCYMQLLEEMSNSYLYDTSLLRERFNAIHDDNCRLEKELARAEGTIEILQAQLESALSWQTASGRKNEVLSSNGLEPEAVKEAMKVDNKFVSADGKTKKEKMMEAAAMAEAGMSNEEIASELGVSQATVKAYISTMKKHYTTFSGGADGDHIVFDDEYGKKTIYLGVYGRDHHYSHQGRIVAMSMG